MKKVIKFTFVTVAMIALMLSTSAATTPTATFTLISGLPAVMHVGDTATVVVQVNSDQTFVLAGALPSFYFPGRGVVSTGNNQQGSNHSGAGTSATLSITYTAKGSTADFPGGVAPVSFVAGVRYGNDGTLGQRYDFNVQVVP